MQAMKLDVEEMSPWMNRRSWSHGTKNKKKNMFRWPSMLKNGYLKGAQNKLNNTLTLWMLKKHL
jgi:hypothetical protein